MSALPHPRFPLERKLPVLIGGLVALTLAVFLVLVSRELKQSAIAGTEDRLRRVTTQLAALVQPNVQLRNTQLAALAANGAIHAFLRGATSLEDSTRQLLTPRGSAIAVRLRAADDRVLLHNPDPLPEPLQREPASLDYAPRGGNPARNPNLPYAGPFYRVGDRTFFWLTRAVENNGAVIGYIDQLRVAGTLGDQAADLIGQDTRIYVTDANGPWLTLTGELIETPGAIPPVRQFAERPGVEGDVVFAHADSITGTGWLMLAEIPVAAVMNRPQSVLQRLIAIGAMLLGLGAIAAWLMSRSVTQPIRKLAQLADAIRAGDYSRRARLERDDEIGRLAGSFDSMLQHIEASHDELGRRFAHAQALAIELEQANLRLQNAIHDANAARTEAQQANRAKDEFLATMSHEIRTPINAMIGYTDLLDVGVAGPMEPRQQEFIERIRVSGRHLIAIVNDVLDFAKIESGQLRLQREECRAAPTINAAVAMLETRARSRNLALTIDCAPTAAFVGDGRRVQQILLNLLSNAVKFTEPGGRVRVTCHRRESQPVRYEVEGAAAVWTCITVTDTGVGIAADQQHIIFEPFVQGAGGYTRPHGGTGLGLAISRSLAHMMGGDITVESQPGAGASFTLWLPHPSSVGAAQLV